MRNKKAQAWYLDFIIAVIIFSIAILIYFVYLPNLYNQELNDLDNIYLDGQFIVSSLMTSGLPENWTTSDVIKIGIVDNSSELNEDLVSEFSSLVISDYDRARNLLGIRSDFVVFFLNNKGNMINIDGVYKIGKSTVQYDTNSDELKIGYYYNLNLVDSLNNYLYSNNLDIDMDSTNSSGLSLSSLDDYDLVILDSAELSISSPDQRSEIETYVFNGGTVFMSYKVLGGYSNLFGVLHSIESSGNDTARITGFDPYLNFNLGDSITCNDSHTVENTYVGSPNASNFQVIAQYYNSNEAAIARWDYGTGTVYYFCEFQSLLNEASSYNDFTEVVSDSVEYFIEDNNINSSISLDLVSYNNLIKMRRIVNYNEKPIAAEVYLWE